MIIVQHEDKRAGVWLACKSRLPRIRQLYLAADLPNRVIHACIGAKLKGHMAYTYAQA